MSDRGNLADALSRRRAVIAAGHRGDGDAARPALHDPDSTVRAAAVGAVARAGVLTTADLTAMLEDPEPAVRRRVVEVAATVASPDAVGAVLARLDDGDPTVVEVAAWALGELAERGPLPDGAVARLAAVATGHDDPLAREAAVASLGAIGDPAGLPAILEATGDRPAVRRRAVLALAPFDGPEVATALERARGDRDWQVREAAELLLSDD